METWKLQRSIVIRCIRWDDFVRFSKEARMVVYGLKVAEGIFRVCALKANVFMYEEALPLPERTEIAKGDQGWEVETRSATATKPPERISKFAIISRQTIRKKFECGVPYSIVPKLVGQKRGWIVEFEYQLDHNAVSQLLSKTLKVSKANVIHGEVLKVIPLTTATSELMYNVSLS